jgi:Tfp pilus assembly ATPase PilU
MQTFDQALFEFVRSERISREAALAACSTPQDFKLLLAAEGQVGAPLPEPATT